MTNNEESVKNLDDNEKFKQCFKHIPKYPMNSNSLRTSSRVTQR